MRSIVRPKYKIGQEVKLKFKFTDYTNKKCTVCKGNYKQTINKIDYYCGNCSFGSEKRITAKTKTRAETIESISTYLALEFDWNNTKVIKQKITYNNRIEESSIIGLAPKKRGNK